MQKRCGACVLFSRTVAIVAVGAFAFFVGSVQAVASHVGCGDSITQDTTLDSDLIDCPGDGIIIGAANITLDLNGHTIDGSGVGACCTSGVSNGREFVSTGYDNVTIKGGTIRQFQAGITLVFTRNNVVRRISASGNGAGISLRDADGTVIERSDASGNAVGIHVRGSGNNLIRTSSISRNRLGVMLIATRGNNVVERSSILDNSDRGMYFVDIFSGVNRILNNRLARNPLGIILVEASRLEIERNSVSHSSVALYLVEGHHSRIERNDLSHNGMGMALLTESRLNQIAWNSVMDNSGVGIALGHSENDYNELLGNLVSRNGEDGIFIGSDNVENVVRENITKRNGDDGIDIDSPMNTLTQNLANRNGDLGIEAVPGVVDGGGNSAAANGNPLQCVSVVCS